MELNIVAGRAKTGKSTYIYDDINNEIQKNSHSNLILIVPDQMTYQTEYEIIERMKHYGIMAAEVLSFTRLGYKVFEEVGGLKIQEINNYGKIMMLKKIFEEKKDELKLFNKSARQEGFLREFDLLISEMKQNSVSVEFLEQILKHKVHEDENQLLNKKLEDIINIYKEINKRTKDAFFDEEDKMELLISAVEHSDYIKNSIIWIDGFESFNNQRHRLVKELLKHSKKVTISLNIKKDSLKNLYITEDWEAFKTVHDTYNLLVKDLDCSINLISLNDNILSDEIKTIEESMFALNSKQFKEKTNNIHLFSSLNPYSEIEKTAQKIISLVRDHNYRWKDILVATGDMDSYGINVKKVFTQYEIPYFLDYKRNIMGNPLTKFILSLFDMFIYNFKHDSVFDFLKTGFSSLNYDEVMKLENFSLQYGIEGERWFRPFKFNAENIEYFNKLREKFTDKLKDAKKKFKSLKTAIDTTLFVFDFLKNYNVQEKIEKQVGIFKRAGEYELSSENAQVWNYVIDIFEQIVLSGADAEITQREYRKIIEAGFNEVNISIIPPSLDKVTVGDIEKVSVKSARVLFIIGANEGKLDSKNNEKGLLLDDEREILAKSGMNLLNDSSYFLYKEKHDLYRIFTNSTEKLYVSYSLGTTDGKSLQPSMYVDKLKEIFPYVIEQTDLNNINENEAISNNMGTVEYLISNIRDFVEGKTIDDVWKDVYAWYENNESNISLLINKGLSYENKTKSITKENLNKIHKLPSTMSVSRLENFAACPFKFFMDNIIKPQPRIVQKIEYYDLGNIYHEAVEQFTKKISQEDKDILELDKDAINSLSESCTEKILIDGAMDYTVFDLNERNKYMKEKIKRLVNRATGTIIEQLKKGSFRPIYTELMVGESSVDNFCIDPVEIKLNENLSVYFQGRIDRVDILKIEDKIYINIIDYKSSYKDIDLSDAVQGLQLQLLVYMSAIIKNGEKLFNTQPEIGGCYYFCIDDPMIDGDEISKEEAEKEIFKKLSLKGYILEDSNIIINMDKDIEKVRKSDIIPVSLNKDGSTSKSSKTLTLKEFKAILSKTDDVAKDIAEKILDGNIDIMPYRKDSGNKIPCEYCEFTGVCQFDPSVDGNNYRRIKKLKKDEILLEILNEGGEDNEI